MDLSETEHSSASPADAFAIPAKGHQGVFLVVELADAVRLRLQDEAGTTRRWQRFVHRARQAVVAQHHGRLVTALDSGLVLSFAHVRRALNAAAELHQLMALANAERSGERSGERPPERPAERPAEPAAERPAERQADRPATHPPMQLRAAIHAGPAGADAAALPDADIRRLAWLNAQGKAGETVLSAAVRERLADGLDATLEDLGDQAGTELGAGPDAPSASADGLTRVYRVAAAGSDPQRPPVPTRGTDLRAAIAVVPFETSGRWGHQQLAIGDLIADGVIGRLSRARHLRVINRLSTQALRGRASTVAELQQHLGASHLLTGEFAESSGRLSIRYELRDLADDSVVRTGRLSATVADLLQQDSAPMAELAQQVHDALFDEAGHAVLSRPLPTLQSFALLLGGIQLLHRSARHDFTASFAVLDHLVREHPRCAEPLIWQAKWYALRAVQGLTADRAAEARAALDCTARALAVEPRNSFALAMQGFVHCVLTRDPDAAATALQQAVAINPNESLGHLFQGMTLGLQGRVEDGIASFGAATATSPLDPACYIYDSIGAYLHLAAGHQAHTVALARRSLRLNREHAHAWRALTIALAELGQLDEARASLHELLRVQPGLTRRSYLAGAGADARNRNRFADALGRAGLPA
jgi:adenylate cyclase